MNGQSRKGLAVVFGVDFGLLHCDGHRLGGSSEVVRGVNGVGRGDGGLHRYRIATYRADGGRNDDGGGVRLSPFEYNGRTRRWFYPSGAGCREAVNGRRAALWDG